MCACVHLFDAGAARVPLDGRVERGALLADQVAAAGAADLRVEQERELVEAAETVALVELPVLRQQLRPFRVLQYLRLDSPVIYTHENRDRGVVVVYANAVRPTYTTPTQTLWMGAGSARSVTEASIKVKGKGFPILDTERWALS